MQRNNFSFHSSLCQNKISIKILFCHEGTVGIQRKKKTQTFPGVEKMVLKVGSTWSREKGCVGTGFYFFFNYAAFVIIHIMKPKTVYILEDFP